MRTIILLFIFLPLVAFSQETTVKGCVIDKITHQALPYVNVFFQDAKIGDITDTNGVFYIKSYYATDSLVVSFVGYQTQTIYIHQGKYQELQIELEISAQTLNDIEVKAPKYSQSVRLFKKVIKYKPVNNREKLDAYQYQTYNKLQLDMNNIGEKFEERKIVQKLDFIDDYIDTNKDGKYLPLLLSESLSDYYYKRAPQKKKEVMQASKITGIENLQLEQFMGDMYQDVNVYDNYIVLFGKSFVSPIADFGLAFYNYYLEDTAVIDNALCFKLRFEPKAKGTLTFTGDMWINDTTYAVKEIVGEMAGDANVNYVEGLKFRQYYDQVEPEVWMLLKENILIDFKLTQKSKLLGFYGRKTTVRRNFVINKPYDDAFYASTNRVEMANDAKKKDTAYWNSHRFVPLSEQEKGIIKMVDTLNKAPFFKGLKNVAYMVYTGFYPTGKIEVGNIFSLVSYNRVEGIRNEFSLRTSNLFSKRIEFKARMAYGWKDERVKYGLYMRYNITPQKRGMLSLYYQNDIEQLGMSAKAKDIGATFGTLLRNAPLNKLTFVRKTGINLEKDIGKDLILYGGFEWKEYTPLGIADYKRYNPLGQVESISKINASEFTLRLRWGYKEEFVSGNFDRKSVGSRYPILSVQSIFGVKGLFGSEYQYQKLQFDMTHTAHLGILGYFQYEVFAGYIFGKAAYPFLEVHPGNQSYYLQTAAFNNMRYFEFVSDRYAGFFFEYHLNGLLLDRIPGVRKLQWRIVTSARAVAGTLGKQHLQEMILPAQTHSLNWKPYVEVGVGIENIFKLIRIECTWRLTQKFTGINNFGIRAKINFDF